MAGTKNDNRKAKHKAHANYMAERGETRAIRGGLAGAGVPTLGAVGSADYRYSLESAKSAKAAKR